MKAKFYQYAACSTCRKAKSWLEKHGVAFEDIPIVERPPSATELKRWITKSGLDSKKFFNTSGLSYRDGKFGEKLPKLDLDGRVKALAADGKLIKRPLIVTSTGDVLVGFDESAYSKSLV